MGELIVYDILGTCKHRVGSLTDGGYILVKEGLDQAEELFSFGVSNDVAFE
jgi:hypothetical protein